MLAFPYTSVPVPRSEIYEVAHGLINTTGRLLTRSLAIPCYPWLWLRDVGGGQLTPICALLSSLLTYCVVIFPLQLEDIHVIQDSIPVHWLITALSLLKSTKSDTVSNSTVPDHRLFSLQDWLQLHGACSRTHPRPGPSCSKLDCFSGSWTASLWLNPAFSNPNINLCCGPVLCFAVFNAAHSRAMVQKF